jgi:long-chain acyl-CoA synthetase
MPATLALTADAIASAADTLTLPTLCFDALERHAKPDAINHKQDDVWLHLSAMDFARRVRHVALGLAVKYDIEAGDRLALISENRVEWSIVDLAILSLGAVNVPIYTTQAPEQVRFILGDSGARLLLVSNRKVYRHARRGIEGTETLEGVIFFDEEARGERPDAVTLADIEELGRAEEARDPAFYDERVRALRPDDLATIIYTSGTTGDPKGVMLSHRNFVSNVLAIAGELPIYPTDVSLSVLPLSHIFERTVFYVFCHSGVSVYYVASFDQVGERLQEVRPTIMTAVPRLFERVYHRIVKKGRSAEGWRKRVFEWALRCGEQAAELRDKGHSLPPALAMQYKLADKLVFSKWREGIGGRLRYFVSGGAPLAPHLTYAFLAAGMPVLQGYGMTETCITAANRPENNRVGSVGMPFTGVEIRIAEDGEILVRGANNMLGYYGHPEATREVFDDEGFFRTGDVGRLDADGRLYITDRKKELFKLSNGKYIAPQQLESLIKESALVSQVVVVGAGRKYPAALVVPDWEALAAALAVERMSLPVERDAWRHDKTAINLVRREVAGLTAVLDDYARVRKVALLVEEFSIDGGEMTPTLKIKRRVIDERYDKIIESLYGDGKAGEE